MTQKKCKRCGACQECGAVQPVYPYQWYPWHGVYPPYRVYPNTYPGIQAGGGTYTQVASSTNPYASTTGYAVSA